MTARLLQQSLAAKRIRSLPQTANGRFVAVISEPPVPGIGPIAADREVSGNYFEGHQSLKSALGKRFAEFSAKLAHHSSGVGGIISPYVMT